MDSPSQSSTQPPELRFDDSGIHSLRLPNFCNVSSAPGEITLLFGQGRMRRDGNGEYDVALKEQIVLAPQSARVLGEMIAKTLQDYEAAHGPLGVQYEPAAPSAPPPKLAADSIALPDDAAMAEKATLLLELIEGLQTTFGFERSFKVFDRTLLQNRFLLGMNAAQFTPQIRTRLPMICKRLGIPEAFLRAFQEELPKADFVHFGFEETEASAIFKVYLEFSGDLRRSIEAQPENPAPTLLDLGYKWDVRDNTKRALSRYLAHPRLSLEAIVDRVTAILTGPEHATTLALTLALLDVAASRVSHRHILYMEVTEESNPRVSFDLNFYGAKLRLAELLPILLQICRRYGIPAEQFQPLYTENQDKIFGHVSGGIDREGRDFLTLYFGVEGRSHQVSLPA